MAQTKRKVIAVSEFEMSYHKACILQDIFEVEMHVEAFGNQCWYMYNYPKKRSDIPTMIDLIVGECYHGNYIPEFLEI